MLSCVVTFLFACITAPTAHAATVNINTATVEELDTLPGIGPAKAEDIIAYREVYGPFASIEDIQNVSGIGPATFEDIRALITVGGETVEDTNSETEPSVPVTTKSGASSKEEAPNPVAALILTAPSIAYVNQPIPFDVAPKDGTDGRLVRYTWNFGDGTTADEKSVIHAYQYPGTYVVVVESYFMKETKTVRKEIRILDAALTVSVQDNEGIAITNNASYEIDLSGYTLSSGAVAMRFPKHTFVLENTTMVVPAFAHNGIVVLRDPKGDVVATSVQSSPSAAPQDENAVFLSESRAEVPSTASVPDSPLVRTAGGDPVVSRESLPAAVPVSSFPYAYLGLVAVLGVGIVGLYARTQPVSERVEI